MIDTNNDSPTELYRIGRWLVDQYATTPAEPQDARPVVADLQQVIDSLADPDGLDAEPAAPLPPAPPPTMADIVSEDDPDVEIDTAGNVTALTTSVSLLPATAPLPPATPAPPGPAVPPEFDQRGMPWDSRIHASNRAKKIDGSWKNKRGVAQDLVTACEAQNKPGNASTPVVPAAATSIPSGTAVASSAGTTAPPAPPAPVAPPAPLPPPPTGGVAAPAAAVPSGPVDFRGLMQKISTATVAGKLSPEQVNAALATVGLKPEDMGQLIGNALYIASVNAAIDACLAS